MNIATAAGKSVEIIDGIPAPIALALTIVGCLAALGWVVFTIVRDGKRMARKS
ncbi:MAG: hypothetical protein NTX53_20425 [candidate division WOR-3 bacterium]|nr:hypothetical protein [candidate division WOR-3 bacterium]